MRIEVVYALPDRQRLVTLEMAEGSTVFEAARSSGMEEQFPGLELENAVLGLFGKRVENPQETVLRDGDRVEIYRPLLIDPKAVRKQRAEKNKKS